MASWLLARSERIFLPPALLREALLRTLVGFGDKHSEKECSECIHDYAEGGSDGGIMRQLVTISTAFRQQ